MKKVLIITYYWPPAGGAGVQRWLKFVKYLGEFGWQPIVFTPANPEAPAKDDSLLKDIPSGLEVLKIPIWEPFDLYKKFTGRKKSDGFSAAFLSDKKKHSFSDDISVWIRGNFFIPDAKFLFVTPAFKYLRNYLRENHIDAIVSSGPPHSMHLIAEKLHKISNIPWLADFRDPWTGIDFYRQLKLTFLADLKHKRLEKRVLKNASAVIAVGKTLAKELSAIKEKEVVVITNGYDSGDLPGYPCFKFKHFELLHVGSINKDRNHDLFWRAIRECVDEIEGFKNHFKLKFIGKIDIDVKDSIARYDINEFVVLQDYMPHDEVLKTEAEAFILYLPVNNSPNARGILTGKFFEYLAVGRPVFAIGPPDGDVAEIIRETGAGVICNFDDLKSMKNALTDFYHDFLSKTSYHGNRAIEKYSRRVLTSKLAETLNFMCND